MHTQDFIHDILDQVERMVEQEIPKPVLQSTRAFLVDLNSYFSRDNSKDGVYMSNRLIGLQHQFRVQYDNLVMEEGNESGQLQNKER